MKHRYNEYTRKDTRKLIFILFYLFIFYLFFIFFFFFCRNFVLKWTRLSLTDRYIGSEKGILHFSFTEIGCPATGP